MQTVQTAPGGLAGWLLECFTALRARVQRAAIAPARELHVLETLSLGGRRQLTLVSCGDERVLVGCGADQVQTIVQIATPKAGAACR